MHTKILVGKSEGIR